MSKLLLKNGVILTMDGEERVIKNGYLAVKEDSIQAIGSMEDTDALAAFSDYEVLECKEKLILPGMINTHSHIPMIAFRGLGDDVPDRLRRYMFPLERRCMEEKLVSAGSQLAFAELILGGVTTVHSTYYFAEETAQAANRCGIRCMLSETVMGEAAPGATEPYGGIARAERLLAQWSGHPLVLPAVNCHAIYTNDTEHLQICHRLARKYNVTLSMHVAEMDYESDLCMKRHGKTPVAYLDGIGLLDERFLAVHAIRVTDEDIELLGERGVKLSHCMGANAKSAKGVAPVRKMLERGLAVGIGSDGPMSGNTIDIFTQLPLIAKVLKLHHKDRTICTARELLRMATINGARALGIDDAVGSLEVGKKADIIVVETDSPNMQPVYDPFSTLVYCANPGNVDSTIVNGEILMKNRKLRTLDWPAAKAKMLRYCGEIQAVADTL